MRSHSSLAIFTIGASHRARPNCALSLATASASRSAKCQIDADAMDVDIEPPVLIPSQVLPGVPFPTYSEKLPRKHALLRSSTPLATSILTNRNDRDTSEPLSPSSENQPPRKRTRTSALLQPPIKSQRLPRGQSRSCSPSRLPRSTSTSSLLFSGRTKDPVSPNSADQEPFTYAFPTSSTMPTFPIVPQSPLLDLISRLIASSSLDLSNPNPSLLAPRTRKPFAGGTILLRSIYKSVLRGLAVKYSVTDLSQVYQKVSLANNSPRSPFDIQDALLADRLRCHLTSQGEDINVIVFEIEKMKDDPPSHPLGDISYERLVSFILLQKRSEGRSRISRKVSERLRKPSRLVESCTID